MKLLRARRSVRRFSDRAVPRGLLRSCVEAARHAPSACNVQPWRFIVVDDAALRRELAAKAFGGIYFPTRWASEAPALVVLMAELDIKANRLGAQLQGTDYYLIDAGIAGEHFVLRAQELGLGTCWIGWFSEKGVRRVLQVPRKYRLVSMIAVGWPAKRRPGAKRLRGMAEILRFNREDR